MYVLYREADYRNQELNFKIAQIMAEIKKCPFCGAEIMVTAKKCRYCGTWLIIAIIFNQRYLYLTDAISIIFYFVGCLMITYGTTTFILLSCKKVGLVRKRIVIVGTITMVLSLIISVFNLNFIVDIDACNLCSYLVLYPLSIAFGITILIMLLSRKSNNAV